jgi:hypothetical protein
MKDQKIEEHRMRKGGHRYIIAGFIVLLILAGSGYLWGIHERPQSGITMSHKYKNEVLGLDCTFCHEMKEDNTRFVTFPDHENCSLCHGGAVDKESEDRNCELCHYLPENITHVRRDMELAPHVFFDHKPHEEQEISCELCHPIPDAPKIVANEMLPPMDTCTACHEERRVMNVEDCSRCHIEGYEKLEPLNHITGWMTTHGKDLSREIIDSDCRICHAPEFDNSCTTCHHEKKYIVEKKGKDYCASCHGKGFDTTRPKDHTVFWNTNHGKGLMQAEIDEECNLCHTPQNDNDCLSCHKMESPKNHTTAWRIRSHGNRAQLDRESCTVCHDQSECISCHTTNEPFSHTGLWGSPYERHCINCHMEGGNYASGAVGSNCTFCHQSSDVWMEHTSLPRSPAHSGFGLNCVSCHRISGGIGTDIRHPFEPDNFSCLSCHP